ncbi:M42 family metallopeptidase [Desulfuribacillus alkaliarsenatis]|uniref:Aminopeptidase n=1 Tax=Desulfuribacillus alkaliarsenatis TaxID=766136 RepID=A0A1E5G6B0_9FIRM|nr:M42 family metallopeptidase [Desulfuribacillus alkaliarsenatis]OEF98712.1 aminopeptidase [Desulfuribacillus alkaliarsenatis]
MHTNNQLVKLVETAGVSGYEQRVQEQLKEILLPFTQDIKIDALGNLIAKKTYGSKKHKPKIMIAAHADEIGFMVTKIEPGGFLRVTAIGGVDPRPVLAQEVIVHGQEDILGIFGAKPPHLLSPADAKKSVPLDELFIDLGRTEAEVKELVQVGDVATINRKYIPLLNSCAAAKAMDDRAGIVMMLEMLNELEKLRVNVDIYIVSTIQEEVGLRGAISSAYGILPDVGFAIDVTHGEMPGVAADLGFELGKGVVIGYGPNIHKNIYNLLTKTAKEENIAYQLEVSQGPTGTDARAIQITQAGIATGLLSIPLRYMHTSVETLSTKDIKNGGKLLAYTIQKIDNSFVEGLRCY